MILLALLLQTTAIEQPDWQNASPENYEKPCETMPFFASASGLAIGGLSFVQSDIEGIAISEGWLQLDAAITLTFSDSGSAKFRSAQTERIGNPIPICLNGRTLLSPVLREYIESNMIQMTGGYTTQQASKIRKELLAALASKNN